MPNGKPDFDVIGANVPIAIMKRTMDNAALQTAIYALIVDFCNSLNVKNSMNRSQCMECAMMLFDKCDMYRLEDYAVMFQMAKRGELIGTTYNKLDITDIAEILASYDAKRQLWVERTQDEDFRVSERKVDNLEVSEEGLKTIRYIEGIFKKDAEQYKRDKLKNIYPKDRNDWEDNINRLKNS